MRRAEAWIAVLLIVATMTTAASARARTLSPQDETQETPLTPYEEFEARAIAEQFIRRFEGSDDLLSIVDDLYVRDFGERLSHSPADRFLVPIDSELALRVKGDELRRYHIVTLRYFYLYVMIYRAWRSAHNADGSAEAEDEFDPLEDLPPRAIAVLKNDPAFAEMIFESSKKDSEANSEPEQQPAVAEETAKKDDEKDQTIRDVEQLRSHVSILEQAVGIMREHLQTLPVPQTWQALTDSLREPDEDSPRDSLHPRILTLTDDELGSPKGTRVICLDVMLFHMDLVRVDGQLRILNVYVAGD